MVVVNFFYNSENTTRHARPVLSPCFRDLVYPSYGQVVIPLVLLPCFRDLVHPPYSQVVIPLVLPPCFRGPCPPTIQPSGNLSFVALSKPEDVLFRLADIHFLIDKSMVVMGYVPSALFTVGLVQGS